MDGLGVSSQPEDRLAGGIPALGDWAGISEPDGCGRGTGEWGLHRDPDLSVRDHFSAVRERSGHVHHRRSSAISIAAVAHGASYQHLYAPGML